MAAQVPKPARYRHVPVLSPRGTKLVLAAVLLLVLGIGVVFLATTAPATFGTPLYWIAFVLWGVGGRLMLPMRVEIPGVRAGKKAILGKWVIPLAALIVGTMAANVTNPTSPITDATAGFAGFWFGIAFTAAYMIPVTQRLRYCANCGAYHWAPRYEGRRYCGACGTVLEGPHEGEPVPGNAP